MTAPNVAYSRIGNVSLPGDALEYSELNIQFILDEDIKSYTELYNWIESLVNKNFVKPNSTSDVPTQADVSVSILSSHNNQSKRILYKGCNPTSLSGLQLTSIASSIEYLTFNASFVFTGFEFKG